MRNNPAVMTASSGGFAQPLKSESNRRLLRPEQLLPSLTAGVVIGILAVVYAISFAALIFSGDLARFVVGGIGLTLFGTFIMGLVTTLLASFAGLIPIAQDVPAAILGVVAAAVAASMPASATADEILATVLAAMILTTILSGGIFFGMGWFKLGRLVRFMPYPVIGGFLAGTGWLIASGAIGIMTDTPLTLAALPALVQPQMLIKWLPGLLLAGLLLVALRRYNHFLLMPGLLLAAVGLFYLMLFLSGTSIDAARNQGWLFEAVAGGTLWRPQALAVLGHTQWPLLLGQAGNVGIVILVSLIAALLNMSGIALAAGRDIDLDRELQVTGLANLLAGLGGSSPGYPALSLSVLGQRLGGDGRLTGVFATGLCGVTLFFGAALITLFPKLVLGGVLLYLGLSLLVEWVYEAWFKLSTAEYALVVVILIIITVFGFLAGVAVGLIVAVGLFVVSYSRVNVVKQAVSGSDYRSNVMRSSQHDQILQRHGDRLYILKLQGFIFFGTAHSLLDPIRQRLERPDLPRLHFVLLDFRLVTGLDSSAALIFTKLKQLAQTHNLVLVFTHLAGSMQQELAKEVFTTPDEILWRLFPDLDHGLEWCETELIQYTETRALPGPPAHSATEMSRLLADNGQALLTYLERREVATGQTLIRQGEPSNGLYFIATGRVTVWLAGDDGSQLRLRTMASGAVVGEVGWYLGQPASASVVADEAGAVYYLSATNLKRMEQKTPDLAIKFHTFIVRLLSERMAKMNDMVQGLQ